MNKILATLVTLFLVGNVWAVRPRPQVLSLKQSDGTSVSATMVGNGHIGFLKTLDGWSMLRGSNSSYFYLENNGDSLVVGNVLVHDEALRSDAEKEYIRTKAVQASDAFNFAYNNIARVSRASSFTTNNADGLGTFGVSAKGSVSSVGYPLIPVIMVQFTDTKFQSYTTRDGLDKIFNLHDYTDKLGSVGSVKDYFKENSDSAFVPSFDIINTVTVPRSHDYYGKNNGNSIDINCSQIISDAIPLAISNSGMDLSKYADANHQISMVAIVYAGMGEHVSNDSTDLIWAHYADLPNTTISQNGVAYRINSYFVGDEIWPTDKTYKKFAPSGTGVFVHEFGHVLGLPDVYSTTSNEAVNSMLWWSVMDSGEWWANGYAPVGYTAYEKSMLGWQHIETLGSEVKTYSLQPMGSKIGTTAYRIVNSGNSKEYYILENHQTSRWFPAAMGYGLLVTHIDYSSSAWSNNVVNNDPSHERFTYVPADNSYAALYSKDYVKEDLQGDLYPGYLKKTELSTTSTPSISNNIYSAGTINPIYKITLTDGVIKFDYITPLPDGVGIVNNDLTSNDVVKVYTIDGRYVTTVKSSEVSGLPLASGVYVVNSSTKSYKMIKQ